MNLLNNFKISTILSTTSGNLGTTGVAVAVSTAGSSGGDSTTRGGFPFPSTGLDMAGYDGVVFIAQSAGSSAGIGGLFASYHANTSTALSTTFTEYPKAHVQGANAAASTVFDTVVLDVYRPVYRYINATLQLAATSEVPVSIVAIQYRGSKAPITTASTTYFIGNGKTVVGTTAAS